MYRSTHVPLWSVGWSVGRAITQAVKRVSWNSETRLLALGSDDRPSCPPLLHIDNLEDLDSAWYLK